MGEGGSEGKGRARARARMQRPRWPIVCRAALAEAHLWTVVCGEERPQIRVALDSGAEVVLVVGQCAAKGTFHAVLDVGPIVQDEDGGNTGFVDPPGDTANGARACALENLMELRCERRGSDDGTLTKRRLRQWAR